MAPPLLALSDYGLVFGVGIVLLLFLVIGFAIIQGTRAQLYVRQRVLEGDVEVIRALVTEELGRWKTMKPPKDVDPATWAGVRSAELVDVTPDGVRVSAVAEGQYAQVNGDRRQVSSALDEGMKVTAKLADMVLYDIPNVRLPYVQVDIYSTYRDEGGASQRCVLSTYARREVADVLPWDELDAEQVVRTFDGRYRLDDRGNPLPIDPDATGPTGVPAVYYKDD